MGKIVFIFACLFVFLVSEILKFLNNVFTSRKNDNFIVLQKRNACFNTIFSLDTGNSIKPFSPKILY